MTFAGEAPSGRGREALSPLLVSVALNRAGADSRASCFILGQGAKSGRVVKRPSSMVQVMVRGGKVRGVPDSAVQ